jgi:glucose/arabinose dehydrogenase
VVARRSTTASGSRPAWFSAAIAVGAVVALAGCGGVSADQPSPRPPTATGTVPAGTGGIPGFADGNEVARGLTVPWGLAFLPGGDALVAERASGRVLLVSPGGGAPRPVYTVPGVAARTEGGLLGLAVSPRYAEDKYVYAYVTAAQDNRIMRFRLDGGTPEVIFDGIAKATNHDGGRIAFGPDGMLYAATGDANHDELAQDPNSPNGKILRLTPEGRPAPGNPVAGSAVYSLGHRNVEGMAWDGAGRLLSSEFGDNDFDEINLIRPAGNYGWPAVEGWGDTAGGRYTNPIVTWKPKDASPSGIAIKGGTLYVAALRGERLWIVPIKDGVPGAPAARLAGRYGRLRTVEIAPDGALWLTTSNTDGRGDAREGDDRIIRFPALPTRS